MNQLPQQTVKRIEEECSELYREGKIRDTTSYISGATSEAQRSAELVKAMQELQEWLKKNRPQLPGLDAPIHLIQQALNNYKV